MAEITANERLEKITNECLEMLEKNIEREKQNPGGDHVAAIRRTGEALKILAEGIEAYKRATKDKPKAQVTAKPM
jgi:hypothetical protein